MARTRATDTSKRSHHRRRSQLALVASLAATTIVTSVLPSLSTPRPQHTSILNGFEFMRELLRGHPESFYDAMGMKRRVIWCLLCEIQRYGGLRNTRKVTAMEKLGAFLWQLRTGTANRHVKQRFQLSGDTISRYAALYHPVLTGT